jgi:hypothetical protein
MSKKKFVFFFEIVLFFLVALSAQAYPHFISYGYSSCATCHFNSVGGGPLTDYGRALFAQEIAARTFVPRDITDESLAEKSGFLGSTQLPFWLRPSIKYRGLWLNRAPTSSEGRRQWIHMQRDFGLLFAFDEDQANVLSYTYGLLPSKKDYYHNGNQVDAISREYYVRTRRGDWNVSIGLMEKAYGIRHSDHTAANRTLIGAGQDDQVHGILAHYIKENWEIAGHYFVGDQAQEKSYQQKGFSLMGEANISEKNRLGLSAMQFKTEFLNATRIAIHQRWGMFAAKGSSIIWEAGLKWDKSSGTDTKFGNYFFAEGLINVSRGYNLISSFDRYKQESSSSAPDTQRWTFGFMTFPLQRTEVRLTAVQTKIYSQDSVAKDQWSLQGQTHVAF